MASTIDRLMTTHSKAWNRGGFRVLLGLIVLVQIAPVIGRTPSTFVQSYWVVSYHDGFVRRGMSGAIAGVFANPLTVSAISALCWAMALVPLIAIIALLELLTRRGGLAAFSMALVLASSPFLIDQMFYHRRPDQIGVALLILMGLALISDSRWRSAYLFCVGIAFAFVCFLHEGAFLYYGTFGVALCAVLASDRRSKMLLMVAAGGPAVAALAVISQLGPADEDQIAFYSDSAPPELRGNTSHYLDYMGDGVGDSIRRVLTDDHTSQAMMLVIGTVLMSGTWWVVTSWVRREFFREVAKVDSPVNSLALVLVLGSIIVTFATGKDWLRWFLTFGSAWLICTAFILLATHDGQDRSGTVEVPWARIGISLLLAVVIPIPQQFP